MRKTAIILTVLTSVAATPAIAQDAQDTQDSGISFRVEARVGYEEVRSDLTVQNGTFGGDVGFGDLMLGVEAGVDSRLSSMLSVGAYVGGDFSRVEGCEDRPFSIRQPSRNDRFCLEADQNLFAGVRVGIPIDDDGMVYAKGGYSRGGFTGSYANTPLPTAAVPNPSAQVLFDGSDDVDGYHFGGGFELNFSSNVYAKAEYVQHRYDDAFTDLLNIGTPRTDPGRNDRVDPVRHQFVFGIGFRF